MLEPNSFGNFWQKKDFSKYQNPLKDKYQSFGTEWVNCDNFWVNYAFEELKSFVRNNDLIYEELFKM